MRTILKKPYTPDLLPLSSIQINQSNYINDIVKANKKLIEAQVLMDKVLITPVFFGLQMRIEAISSTRIEGTRTNIKEVLDYESDKFMKSVKSSNDIQEVLNYMDAIRDAKNDIENYSISSRTIKNIHSNLLKNEVRGSDKLTGEYRRVDVHVGSRDNIEYYPPRQSEVNSYISNLENYINGRYEKDTPAEMIKFDEELDPLIKTAIMHAQFETIHPFTDGNGRVGRVLIPIYLYQQGMIKEPSTFFLSRTLERVKHKYYAYLNETRWNKEDGWENWIVFFLESIVEHCEQQISLINEVETLYNETCKKVKSVSRSIKLLEAVDSLFKMPISNTSFLMNELNISNSTANNYFRQLEKQKIVFSDNKGRNRKYYFYDLLNIIDPEV